MEARTEGLALGSVTIQEYSMSRYMMFQNKQQFRNPSHSTHTRTRTRTHTLLQGSHLPTTAQLSEAPSPFPAGTPIIKAMAQQEDTVLGGFSPGCLYTALQDIFEVTLCTACTKATQFSSVFRFLFRHIPLSIYFFICSWLLSATLPFQFFTSALWDDFVFSSAFKVCLAGCS